MKSPAMESTRTKAPKFSALLFAVALLCASCTAYREQDGERKRLLVAVGGRGQVDGLLAYNNEKSFTDAADTGRKIFNTAAIAGVAKDTLAANIKTKQIDAAAAANSERTAAALESQRIEAARAAAAAE